MITRGPLGVDGNEVVSMACASWLVYTASTESYTKPASSITYWGLKSEQKKPEEEKEVKDWALTVASTSRNCRWLTPLKFFFLSILFYLRSTIESVIDN